MWLKLRQIALVAEHLGPLERAFVGIFALAPCYRDPAVAEFGLENVLFPVGDQFLEVVAPTRTGTAAGRYLERRAGDGGYMVITQCDDHERRRQRVATLGVRIAHEFQAPDFRNLQLHPRDTGGSFFEIDQQLGNSDDWVPAGRDWRSCVRTQRVTAIAVAEIQADDPGAVAERWSAIAELPLDLKASYPTLQLANATVRFVPCIDGRPEGLAALDLIATDRSAVLAAASAHGIATTADGFTLGGMRWRLV